MTDTLKEARDYLYASLEDGTKCPCCDRLAKIYVKRTITSSMARGLIHLVKKGLLTGERPWYHVQNEFAKAGLRAGRGGDFNKFRYWDMIEPEVGGVRDDGSSRTGIWRVTERGQDFVLGRIRVRKYVAIYAKQRYTEWETNTETMGIRDALGKKFSYDELMGRT